MESYTGLKWVKRECSLPQIFSLVCQNVSEEVLLTEPKIQAKIPSHSGDCVLGEGQLNTLSLMVKSLGYSAYHEDGARPGVSYLIHYSALLQNATDIITKCDNFITKCDRYYYKMRLLKNATFITNCDSTHKNKNKKKNT